MDINSFNKVKGGLVRDSAKYHARNFCDGKEPLAKVIDQIDGLPIMIISFIDAIVQSKKFAEAKFLANEYNVEK